MSTEIPGIKFTATLEVSHPDAGVTRIYVEGREPIHIESRLADLIDYIQKVQRNAS